VTKNHLQKVFFFFQNLYYEEVFHFNENCNFLHLFFMYFNFLHLYVGILIPWWARIHRAIDKMIFTLPLSKTISYFRRIFLSSSLFSCTYIHPFILCKVHKVIILFFIKLSFYSSQSYHFILHKVIILFFTKLSFILHKVIIYSS